jgi:hypothetical protein
MPRVSQNLPAEAASNKISAERNFRADHVSLFKEEDVVQHIQASTPNLRIMYAVTDPVSLQRD